MSQTNLSNIYNPQFVPSAAAALTFSPASAAGAPTVVPASYAFMILTMRVVNVSAAPVALTVWRVPSGSANDNQHLAIPATVNIPVASANAPWFDVGSMFGAVLNAGDAVWALAGTASTLSIMADGVTISL